MQQLECAGILFDLDGVLIDSTAAITRHWKEWAQQHGLALDAIMQVAHGRPTLETMRLAAPHLAAETVAAEAQRFAAGEVLDTKGILTIDGALPLLNSLPADAWAIVTSCTRDLAIARLQSRGLPVPQHMVTADDVTHGKPHPAPYLKGAALLALAPRDCIVVEDAPAGLAAAAAAGMRSIGVLSTHAAEELAGATAVAARLDDLEVVAESGSQLTIRICS